MRSATLLCLFVLFGYLTNAQFTILPQVGFENSQTSIAFNELSSFSPVGAKLSPQAGIRLDYKFKQMHGPFVGIATSRSVVKFNFSDPAIAMNTYTASRGTTQFRLEGGYQLSSKPIYFKKSGSARISPTIHGQNGSVKRSCGSSIARNTCGSKSSKAIAAKSKDRGAWVRIQPSLGIAYIPFTPTSEINTKSQATQTVYEYNAGNWKTALISGIGFEFGRKSQSTFIVSLNYLKGVGANLNTKNITTVSGNKPANSSLKSDASGWNLRMGIPISLHKNKPVVKPPVIEKTYREQKKCGQYKSRCSKVI
ncbi:MAG: hypothetical protein H7Z13_18870 [Ferruginibacter sp.]|nr:hypothetical protein [Ferruginibacter sp.]